MQQLPELHDAQVQRRLLLLQLLQVELTSCGARADPSGGLLAA